MMLGWGGEDTVELDGGRDEPAHDRYDEARSYEAVGRFIVRNCDLLIAVWNGKPGKGRGGTADIVQFAADSGPPVWWIHAERDTSPMWIGDGRDLNPAVAPQDATQALRDYLEQLILPPELSPPHHQGHSCLERIAHIGQTPDEPLGVYYAETPLPRRWWAQAYRRLMKLAAGYEPCWQPSRAEDRVAAFWHNAYDMPDKRAGEYAARYRSTYVWVFGLAAIALASAAVSLGVTGQHASHALKFVATAVELAVLLLILVFVITNIRHDWHQRWIDYRLLAELYRKQQALAVLGWSLSGGAVQALVAQKEERAAWLIWLFAAMLRTAPLPRGRFTAQRCAEAREIVQRELVEEQLSYHNGRLTQCECAGRSFVRLGEALFFIVIGVVVAKLVLLGLAGPTGGRRRSVSPPPYCRPSLLPLSACGPMPSWSSSPSSRGT